MNRKLKDRHFVCKNYQPEDCDISEYGMFTITSENIEKIKRVEEILLKNEDFFCITLYGIAYIGFNSDTLLEKNKQYLIDNLDEKNNEVIEINEVIYDEFDKEKDDMFDISYYKVYSKKIDGKIYTSIIVYSYTDTMSSYIIEGPETEL